MINTTQAKKLEKETAGHLTCQKVHKMIIRIHTSNLLGNFQLEDGCTYVFQDFCPAKIDYFTMPCPVNF
jgi:hypothetical protein